jgi:hypothetical protein
MTNPIDHMTIKIRTSTHPRLRLLAAITGESQLGVIDRLVDEELKRVQENQASNHWIPLGDPQEA